MTDRLRSRINADDRVEGMPLIPVSHDRGDLICRLAFDESGARGHAKFAQQCHLLPEYSYHLKRLDFGKTSSGCFLLIMVMQLADFR